MSERLRSALRGLSTVLIVAGVLLIADAVTTLVWQEPVSAFLASRDQDRLEDDFAELAEAEPSRLEARALSVLKQPTQRMAFLARAQKREAGDGDAVARIRIPEIGVDKVVVNGTDPGDLREGPGLYPQTPYPGVPGTTAIAGHRTTYGAPFRKIDKLGPGDEIVVEMSYGHFTYKVEKSEIVDPTELSVIRRVGHDRLVLTACHPLYSAAQRIVVFARLENAEPKGPAAGDQTLVETPPETG